MNEIKGIINAIVFHNERSGFTVLDASVGNDKLCVVGEVFGVSVGEEFCASGDFIEHPNYGTQFRVSSFCVQQPTTSEAILRYLSGGAIRGIGPVLAKRIVSRFGEQTLEVLEKTPGQLCEIKGITQKKANEFAKEYANINGLRAVLNFLKTFEIEPVKAVAVWKKWGSHSVNIIRNDPYVMCTSDIGISFHTAESIAAGFGMSAEEPCRIRGGLLFILIHNIGNGHTCLPYHKVIEAAGNLLDVSKEMMEDEIGKLKSNQQIIERTINSLRYLYLPDYFNSEQYVSDRLNFMLALRLNPPASVHDDDLAALESSLSIQYAPKQKQAMMAAANNNIVILTGGPGTGKTTALKGMISLTEALGEKVGLAAPTGRAAKRLSEVTGKEAKTIHRVLEPESFDGSERLRFQRNERNPLPYDMIIIDEMSMVDIRLFEALLRACRNDTKLVLVGDPDQLPSVGAGNVLRDLIDSDRFPCIHLTEIFRQAAQSGIVVAAHDIVRGHIPNLTRNDNDLFFLSRKDAEQAAITVVDLCTRRLPLAYNLDINGDIQIIVPTRLGKAGTAQLNQLMQDAINPHHEKKTEIRHPFSVFRVGDKVMQTKNNYNILWEKTDGEAGMGVFNGDIGFIEDIDRASNSVKVNFDGRFSFYTFDQMNEIELAYAITVHKSQGNEFDTVVILLIGRHRKLHYRNLLYTAVTRAKKRLVIVGDTQTVEEMVSNAQKSLRYTSLAYMLREEVDF